MGALRRPQGLGEDEWAAIKDAEDRLLRAKAAADAPLVLGSAKDLCEAIAKVVIAERGSVQGSEADIPELIRWPTSFSSSSRAKASRPIQRRGR
jgi:hypothetical protein